MRIQVDGPHDGQPILAAGPAPGDARGVVVLAHGRGGSAEEMLHLGRELGDDLALLAPQAAGHTWYPYSFLAPLERNEPWLSSALDALGQVVASAGSPERVLLVGFSQGACLVSEFVARHPARYGGVAVLSGGLIGAEGAWHYDEGVLGGVPVFLGCSDVDPHIPVARVHITRDLLERMGAEVDERIYEGMGHTVNADELDAVRALAARLG